MRTGKTSLLYLLRIKANRFYSLQFNIVCKQLGAERMSFYINEAANEVRDLLMPDLLAQSEKAKL